MSERKYITAEELEIKRKALESERDSSMLAGIGLHILSDLYALRAELKAAQEENKRLNGIIKAIPCHLNHEASQWYLCAACRAKEQA